MEKKKTLTEELAEAMRSPREQEKGPLHLTVKRSIESFLRTHQKRVPNGKKGSRLESLGEVVERLLERLRDETEEILGRQTAQSQHKNT